MRILYIAYPLLPVTEESAGGAEQILLTLEREIRAQGHHTAVAACSGSQVAGDLVETGAAANGIDQYEEREREHARHIFAHLAGPSYDLIHDMSGSFWKQAAAIDAPILATLHLPRSFYPPNLLLENAPNVHFACVSSAQLHSFAGVPGLLGFVQNGIAGERFPFTAEKNDYLLWLGRICEEKGTHIAMEVAERLRTPLVIAGQVYPFSYHQSYFQTQVQPHLGPPGSPVNFVESPSRDRKLELVRRARALLITSLCEETSSLVALEAMACGTPVIAFRRGGIPEIVAHHQTGIVVDSIEEMAEAVKQVGKISPYACRVHVAAFSAQKMAGDYLRLYDVLISG